MNADRQIEVNPEQALEVFESWLEKRLDAARIEPLKKLLRRFSKDAEEWEIFSGFSRYPRKLGRTPLNLDREESDQALALRSDWLPERWRTDRLVRLMLLLALSRRGRESWLEILDKLFASSDMEEAISLYQSLPLLPWPESLRERAAEGVRSNITSAFEATALENPYPADWLETNAWNQMVLKALFVGSPLYRIIGLERRANRELGRMLIDYARERRAAGRPVPVELWRALAPVAEPAHADDIALGLKSEDLLTRTAIRNLILESGQKELEQLLERQPKSLTEELPDLSWEEIGRRSQQPTD